MPTGKEPDPKDRTIAAIFRISNLLTRQAGLDEILRSILVSAERDLGFSASCLFLLRGDGEHLDCRMVRGFGEENEKKAYRKPFHMERHDCIETRAVKGGEVIHFEDSRTDPRATAIDRRVTERLARGQILYAPLTLKGTIIGCMGVNRPAGEPRITASEIEAFTIFANQASIVIENSRSHEQLLEERNLNKSILESSPSGILTLDRRGTVTAMNREAARILRTDPARILSGSIRDAASRAEGFGVFEPFFRNPVSQAREVDYPGEDGLQHSVEVTVTPLSDEGGREAGTLFFFRDQTEQKHAREQIQRMGQLAAVGQLAAGISHEIRNPMMGIAATLELISDGLDPDHPHRRLLAKSMEEIGRVDHVLGELLGLAQARTLSPEPTDINRLVADVADFLSGLCRKRKIDLRLESHEAVPAATLDRNAIRELLVNLALNAVQSMKHGGTLKIASGVLDRRLYGMEPGSAQVTIEDTGEGIPPGIRDKLFDPFFTTRPDGTGLGLYHCQKIVEAHRGAIVVEDGPVRGTRVHVLLPRSRGEDG